MFRLHPLDRAPGSRAAQTFGSACRLAILAVLLAPASALAAVSWHADLAAAKAAAAASDRPVLAVFTANWTATAGTSDPAVLASPEAEAVVSACFEAVRIDVDAQPQLTKELGISHVPSACIIAADDSVLARFELPASTPEFVAAAAKAAQAAAAHRASLAEQSDLRIRVSPAAAQGRGNAFAPTAPPAGSASAAAAAPGSISLVTAKVRELSDFANTDAPPAAGSGFRPVAPQSVATAAPPLDAAARFPLDAPATGAPGITAPGMAAAAAPAQSGSAFALGPAGWPTETAPAPLAATAPPAPTTRPALEPSASAIVQSGPAATAPSWLSGQPPAMAAQPAPAQPTPDTAVAPATPEPPKSFQAQFLAAIQKPFTFWQKSPEVPKPSAAATATPPTMPPALPLAAGAVPGADVTAATLPATGAGTNTPDPYGSMPLGLEGYCPVTLAEKGQWTEGRAQWGARHRGRTYLFAGEDQQRAFLADPDRYAPALSGDDPVLAFDAGTSAPGQRRYGVTYQSRMYLFSSPETRSQFAANPARYTGRVALAELPPQPAGTILR